ncbi:MAG: hypothetical protein ACYC1P_04225 [Gaiellaceae bacterium]
MTGLRSPRYKTDFEETPDGDVVTLPGYGGDNIIPAVGEDVELFDADGNTCRARVTRVDDNNLIHFDPNWGTWSESRGPVEDLLDVLKQRALGLLQPLDETERETSTKGEDEDAQVELKLRA